MNCPQMARVMALFARRCDASDRLTVEAILIGANQVCPVEVKRLLENATFKFLV